MAEILMCKNFYVKALGLGCYVAQCSETGHFLIICNPLNPRCGCPHYRAELAKFEDVSGEAARKVIQAVVKIAHKKALQALTEAESY